MNASMGSWPRAPLAYVLAEVRTEQLADLGQYRAALSSAFRAKGYPIQRPLLSARILTSGEGVQSLEAQTDGAWEFAVPENNNALIVRPHGFVFHATKYVNHADFLERFRAALAVVQEIVPDVYVNRLGLRYVDFILPNKGEQPEAYVDSRLNPLLPISKSGQAVVAMSVVIYPMGDGGLTVRYMRGAGLPDLPPELINIQLEKSEQMQRRDIEKDQPTAILDLDRISEIKKPVRLDSANLRERLQKLRDDVHDAFMNKISTDHAKTTWRMK